MEDNHFMIKTVKDLLNYYNITPEKELPEYILNHQLGEPVESYGEYHKETVEGKTIHVFTTENKVDGQNVKIENILDLNTPPSWTEIIHTEDSKTPAYSQIIFDENLEITTNN